MKLINVLKTKLINDNETLIVEKYIKIFLYISSLRVYTPFFSNDVIAC